MSYEYKNNPDETGATKQYGYQKLNITNGVGILTSQDGSTTKLTGTMRARLLTYEDANRLRTNNSMYHYRLLRSLVLLQKSHFWFLIIQK